MEEEAGETDVGAAVEDPRRRGRGLKLEASV